MGVIIALFVVTAVVGSFIIASTNWEVDNEE